MKYLNLICMLILAFTSCNLFHNSKLTGAYSNDDIVLDFNEDGTYHLEVAKGELELDKEPTKMSGSYELMNSLLVLKIKDTNSKGYRIEIPPQTYIDGYEIRVQGNGWGGLSAVHCKVFENGTTTQDAYTDERGIVKLDFTENGTLIIQHKGWETAEISLADLRARSFMITLEKENYKASFPDYEFEISGEILKGRKEIKHWELKKTNPSNH